MKRYELSEPVPGIWRVLQQDTSAYIVKLSPGAVIIDTGREASASAVMMGLQAARVGMSSVRAILLTSLELTATGGLSALRSRTGAPALGPASDGCHDGGLEIQELVPGRVANEHFEAVAVSAREALGYYFRPARVLFCGAAPTPASDLDIAVTLRRF